MDDSDDKLIIEQSAGGQFISLIVFTAIDGLLIALIKTEFSNGYQEISIYTPIWWILIGVQFLIAIILTIALVVGSVDFFRWSSTSSSLVISKLGILLPFSNPKDVIMWEDISTFYVLEPDLQKTRCKYLYIEILNPKFSLRNMFRSRKILVIARELWRLDDLDNVLYYIDKYFKN